MLNKKSIKLVEDFIECIENSEGRHKLTQIISTDCVSHGTCLGVEDVNTVVEMQSYIEKIHHAFSDFQIKIKDLFGDDERICLRFEGQGIHDGNALFGVPAFNEEITYDSFNIFKVEDGKIKEHWGTSNLYQKMTS
ncbi:ester cyclase [Aureivirga sp. CE67]|uniref:ester cyclase n=1 Tax=Aureivirga sp. CE67 TaxID=1788983 RepID=UPI0018C8E071|nr:ester cyclase [Aureivirga sp. CE67]